MRFGRSVVLVVSGLWLGCAGGQEAAPRGGSDGGAGSAPCVKPGEPGNALGVGRYCTKGGGQCPLTAFGRFCAADFRSDAPPFCTNACGRDEDCGAGAVCPPPQADGSRGCVPIACLSSPELPSDGTPPSAPPPPSSDAGSQPGCVRPGDVGNSLGVGRYCVADKDCSANSFAKYCAAAHEPGAPNLCTNLCSQDGECGSDATCVGAGLNRGCVPLRCQGSPDGGTQDGGAADGGMSLGCLRLSACCAAPSFPSDLRRICELSTQGTAVFCDLARASYELGGFCPSP